MSEPPREDPWDDPTMKEWADDARENLLPKLRKADATISLAPGEDPDIKVAVELGLSILMDKPIISVVLDGRRLPDKLVQVSDAIVHLQSDELGTASGQTKIHAALDRVLGPDDDE